MLSSCPKCLALSIAAALIGGGGGGSAFISPTLPVSSRSAPHRPSAASGAEERGRRCDRLTTLSPAPLVLAAGRGWGSGVCALQGRRSSSRLGAGAANENEEARDADGVGAQQKGDGEVEGTEENATALSALAAAAAAPTAGEMAKEWPDWMNLEAEEDEDETEETRAAKEEERIALQKLQQLRKEERDVKREERIKKKKQQKIERKQRKLDKNRPVEPDPVAFSRPFSLTKLTKRRSRSFKVISTEEERQALAKRFLYLGIGKLEASMTVSREEGASDIIVVEGSLEGEVDLECARTTRPFTKVVKGVFTTKIRERAEQDDDDEDGVGGMIAGAVSVTAAPGLDSSSLGLFNQAFSGGIMGGDGDDDDDWGSESGGEIGEIDEEVEHGSDLDLGELAAQYFSLEVGMWNRHPDEEDRPYDFRRIMREMGATNPSLMDMVEDDFPTEEFQA